VEITTLYGKNEPLEQLATKQSAPWTNFYCRTLDAQCNIIWQQLWVSAQLHMEYLEDWSFHSRCEPSQLHDNDHRTHTHCVQTSKCVCKVNQLCTMRV